MSHAWAYADEEWGECEASEEESSSSSSVASSCGAAGIQARRVVCKELVTGDAADDGACDAVDSAVPPLVRSCIIDSFAACRYKWHVTAHATVAEAGWGTAHWQPQERHTKVSEEGGGGEEEHGSSSSPGPGSSNMSLLIVEAGSWIEAKEGGWNPCPAECGFSAQTRRVPCLREDGAIVSDATCLRYFLWEEQERLRISISTTTEFPQSNETTADVTTTALSSPSAVAGIGVETAFDANVAASLLPLERKPPTSRPCRTQSACVFGTQRPMSWDNPSLRCSSSCGRGTLRRRSHCEVKTFGSEINGDSVHPDLCRDPAANASWFEAECVDYSGCCHEWVVGTWAQCTHACGTSIMSRAVRCERKPACSIESTAAAPSAMGMGGGIGVEEAWCVSKPQPAATQSCTSYVSCEYKWHASAWGDCLPACGQSKKRRNLSCLRPDGVYVDRIHCSGEEEPSLEAECESYAGCAFAWHIKEEG